MAMKKKPVTGMKDILPKEMAIRDYCIALIKDTYKTFGFNSMETPCVEHIENLNSKQGGENEKLIFKILKRGEKLKIDEAKEELDLVDGGLRYDLTVPLCRYYSNNANELPSPFKALQMGNVWRADRPQKGRYREFYQCDADVVGSDSLLNEVELVEIIDEVFSRFGIRVDININNRKILAAIAEKIGAADKITAVTVAIDKLEKIGLEGVEKELLDEGISQEAVKDLEPIIALSGSNEEKIATMRKQFENSETGMKGIGEVEFVLGALKNSSLKNSVTFNLSLARGLNYYTGCIFEVKALDYAIGSITGGGRYDKLIGKFIGRDIPAVGFSIGFERIFAILSENGATCAETKKRIALLYDEGQVAEAVKEADKLRAEGLIVSLFVKPKKTGKFIDKLEEKGFAGFINLSVKPDVVYFEN